jgi:hypothetical protein
MKKLLLPFFALALFLSSCKNDIDINADWKETPIIYGLLNADSTRQFIKVYKAFLDENISALDVAQNADSIYYTDDVDVTIEKKSNGQKIALTKVDGNTLGLAMDSGVFANSPNILYLYNQTIDPNETYIVRFYNPRTGKTASAETKIVNDFQINFPPSSYDFNFTSPNALKIEWKSAKNGKVTDLIMRFTYEEWNINNPSDVQTKTVDWKLASGVISGGTGGGEQLSSTMLGRDFFTFLKSQLTENSELRRRAKTTPIALYFYTGGDELYNFIRVNQAQSGITSLQTLPEYTNVEGGLGIFSSRKHKLRGDLGLNTLTLDSLSCGSVTGKLNFVNVNCF